MTELVQFGVIKDLRGELRKYDEKLLRLDPFSRLTPHHFTEYRRVRPLDLESRWAFFYQKHGIEKGPGTLLDRTGNSFCLQRLA